MDHAGERIAVVIRSERTGWNGALVAVLLGPADGSVKAMFRAFLERYAPGRDGASLDVGALDFGYVGYGIRRGILDRLKAEGVTVFASPSRTTDVSGVDDTEWLFVSWLVTQPGWRLATDVSWVDVNDPQFGVTDRLT